jgi:hypothetical protein
MTYRECEEAAIFDCGGMATAAKNSVRFSAPIG